jgi:hypothetical protein
MGKILALVLTVLLSGCVAFTPYSPTINSPKASGYTFSAKHDPENRRGLVLFANGELVAKTDASGALSGTLPGTDGRKVWADCQSKLIGINILLLPSFDTLCTIYIDSTEVGIVYPSY